MAPMRILLWWVCRCLLGFNVVNVVIVIGAKRSITEEIVM